MAFTDELWWKEYSILEIKICGITHRGKVRKKNQDSMHFDETMRFGMVADGVGGLPGGEVASKLAVDTVADGIWSSASIKYSEVNSFMLKQVYKANYKILDHGQKQPEHKGLGTTLDFIYFVGDVAHMIHVGDSRIYLFYCDHLFQLTIDHNIETLAHREQISLRQKSIKKDKAKITRGLGLQDDVEPDIFQKPIYSGEIYLLASDGLFDMVEDSHIKAIIAENSAHLERIPNKLTNEALKNGGHDNISIVLCEVI